MMVVKILPMLHGSKVNIDLKFLGLGGVFSGLGDLGINYRSQPACFHHWGVSFDVVQCY